MIVPGQAPDNIHLDAVPPRWPRTISHPWSLRTALVPLEVALLFTASLNYDKWSVVAVLGLCGWLGFRWCARPLIHLAFASRLALLALFAAVFFLIAASFGYYVENEPAKWFIVVVGLYALGYSAGLDPPSTQMWKLLGITGGFATFAFLSVWNTLEAPTLFGIPEIAEREAASYWGQASIIAGTGLGALASLAMCLLPAAFARMSSGGERTATIVPWRGLVVLVAALGFFTNIALQNRTPIIAFAGTLLATGVLMTYLRPASSTKRFMAAAILAGVVVLAFEWGAILHALAPEYGLARRLSERGMETGRYTAWIATLASLPRHPFGGRLIDLGEESYAHNLWLDVALDAGVLPALLLVAFHASHLGAIGRLFRGDAPSPVRVALIGLGMSFLATFIAEPVMQFSVMYFAVSGYVLANASAISARTWVDGST